MATPVLFLAKSHVTAHRRRKPGGGMVFVRDYMNRIQAQGRAPAQPKAATADTRTGDLFARPPEKKPASDPEGTPAGWRKDGPRRHKRSWKVDSGKRDHRLFITILQERSIDGDFTFGVRDRWLGERGYVWGGGSGPFFAHTLADATKQAEERAAAFLQRNKKAQA